MDTLSHYFIEVFKFVLFLEKKFYIFFYRKYQLRKVMVNGDVPPRVKKDAHAVILEFIRSRPPLRKVCTHIYNRLLL